MAYAIVLVAVVGITLAVLWLFEKVAMTRDRLWREATNQRLANQQGDVLRIEQKLDEMDVRVHVTLGALSQTIDDHALSLGSQAFDLAREKKHADVVSTAGELILSTIRVLRDRIEKLEQRADEADQQIAAICQWGAALDEWIAAKCPGTLVSMPLFRSLEISARKKDGLPSRVDLSDLVHRPVFDQGQLGAAGPHIASK